MQIAVYVLYQKRELAKATCFLTQVARFLGPDITLWLLINDQDCPDIRGVAAGLSPRIRVLCEGRNLGVAGGRNHLIRRAIDAGAEFFISCDTDIIFEQDYFRRMARAWQEIRALDPQVALIQPVLLDGPQVAGCFAALDQLRDWSQLCQRLAAGPTSLKQSFWPQVRTALGGEAALKTIMHAGISNVWAAHFGAAIMPADAPDKAPDFVATYRTAFPSLRSDPALLDAIMAQGAPVRIGTTAGGISAFHRSFFENAGGYDGIFNPFGFEDSEFGFRTQAAGFHHYLLPKLTAIHDPFVSGQPRSLAYAARIGLLRGVEAGAGNLTAQQRQFTIRQSVFFGLRQLVQTFARHEKDDAGKQAEAVSLLPSVMASYGFEFFRGLLHAAVRDGTRELASLTALLTPGRQVVEPVVMPLDNGVRLVSRRVIKSGDLPIAPGQRFGLHAFDCHIQETAGDEVLPSRHFDLSVQILRPGASNEYILTADILSDDVLHKLRMSFRFDPENAARDGIVQISDFDCQTKAHDYGTFQVEDLYPEPRLHMSNTWLPMVLEQLHILGRSGESFGLNAPLDALKNYLELGKGLTPKSGRAAPFAITDPDRRRVLIFTDSRGQHKPRGCDHDIFAERMAKDPRLEVDSYLCPMKWTTTLDFLQSFTAEQLARYDHVILYTGIVEWSPRKLSNAVEDLYDRQLAENLGNLALNTRDYSRKVVNAKKAKFDEVFGADVMARHFAAPFATMYEGEPTINMYPLEAGVADLASRLRAIPNLIFITANRIVPGWRGDYPRERPANMAIIHDYSTRFAASLPRARLVDLMEWDDEAVKRYTCDNLHLTEAGSDWIYDRLMERLQMTPQANPIPTTQGARPTAAPPVALPTAASKSTFHWPEITFQPFKAIERMTPAKISALTKRAGREGKKLATLVIGLRLLDEAPERLTNLRALLDWIDYHYSELFDILLIEQDAEPKLDFSALGARDYVRHEFIFNDKEYNRGWGYNVAVKHFCKDTDVVALMDTDVLTGAGFVSGILSCFETADVCSPYVSVYYSSKSEADLILETRKIDHLKDPAHIKNPVTLCGGIVIFRRSTFLTLKGFEQYIGYSCEDRALDVTILNHVDPSRIKVLPETYVHLFHPSDQAARVNFDLIFSHLQSNYSCRYHKEIKPFEYIHRLCEHPPAARTAELIVERDPDFANLELYRSGAPLAINGQRERPSALAYPKVAEAIGDLVFPPDFESLSDYAEREFYAGTEPPDSEELATFYNRYQGDRCFIIGNGPSLNRHDLSLLEGEFSLGVNSFYYKTRDTGFMPTFYVVEDSSVMKENIEEIRAFDAPFKFFPTIYRRYIPKAPNTLFFEMNRGFYEKSSPNYVVPRFSTDASKVLYCGQSVTYINLQLAFFMGFTEVHLIGMDFDYVIPDSHKRTGDVLLSDTDDPNHFHKDYFGKGKTWKDPKLERVALNYRQAKLSFEAVGRKIYNATSGGKLDVFERVDYEALLRDPKTGLKRNERIPPPVTSPPTKGDQALIVVATDEIGRTDSDPRNVLLRAAASYLLGGAAFPAEPDAAIGCALGSLPAEDPVVVHFRKVLALRTA